MHRHFRTALKLTAMMACVVAHAPSAFAAEPTRLGWRCHYEADEMYNIACSPNAFTPDGTDVTPPPALVPVATSPRADYRPVAMRGDSEIFSVEVWRVPLFGPPTDRERVHELLRAVLCGRHADCFVHVDEGLHAQALGRRR